MKSKKILCLIAVFLLFIVTSLGLAACGQKAKLTQLELDTSKVVKTFEKGQDLDLSKLVVRAIYSDKSEKILTDKDYTIDRGNFNKDVAGQYTITISYKKVSANFKVNVIETPTIPTIASLRLDTTKVKTNYALNEDFSATGLKVYAVYTDSSENELAANKYTIDSSAYIKETAGTYAIKVTLNENTNIKANFNVTVLAADQHVLVDIELDISEIEEFYLLNQDFSAEGLKVYKKYADGQKELITDSNEYLVDSSDFLKTTEGVYTIKVTLKNTIFSKTFEVWVVSATPTEVVLDTNGVKKNFAWGEEFNANGLIVKIKDSNNQETTIDEYTISSANYQKYKEGNYDILVKVGSLSKTYQVSVAAPTQETINELLSFENISLIYNDLEIILTSEDFITDNDKLKVALYCFKDAQFTVNVEKESLLTYFKYDTIVNDTFTVEFDKDEQTLDINLKLYLIDNEEEYFKDLVITIMATSLGTTTIDQEEYTNNIANRNILIDPKDEAITISNTFNQVNGHEYNFISWYVDGVKQDGNTYSITDSKTKEKIVITFVFSNQDSNYTIASLTIFFQQQKDTLKVEGDYIYFGEYPSTIKDENVTISDEADKNGYYIGSDGEKYIKLDFNLGQTWNYAYKTFSNGTTFEVKTDYTCYFKVEPMKWKIIKKDTDKYLLLATTIIDQEEFQPYVNSNYKIVQTNMPIDYKNYITNLIEENQKNLNNIRPDDYEYSYLRYVLNNSFYNMAFNEAQKALIKDSSLENGPDTTNKLPSGKKDNYDYATVTDKVFLLSYADLINEEYGFNTDPDAQDEARKFKVTDYAMAKGVYTYTDTLTGSYWTRSKNLSDHPIVEGAMVNRVFSSGSLSGSDVKSYLEGYTPALWIDATNIH